MKGQCSAHQNYAGNKPADHNRILPTHWLYLNWSLTKSWAHYGTYLQFQSWGGKGRRNPGACWSASLAKSETCVQWETLSQNTVRISQREANIGSSLHRHSCPDSIYAHTYSMYAHKYTIHKENGKKRDWVFFWGGCLLQITEGKFRHLKIKIKTEYEQRLIWNGSRT